MVRKTVVGLPAAVLLLLAVTLVPTSANAWHRRDWSPGFSISFGFEPSIWGGSTYNWGYPGYSRPYWGGGRHYGYRRALWRPRYYGWGDPSYRSRWAYRPSLFAPYPVTYGRPVAYRGWGANQCRTVRVRHRHHWHRVRRCW